ncbi:aldehyde dehydrogenase family protein [Shewanella eurypsychrophilus]|uniref:Aldehyde dehydrogenase family protein n=1 Tax=Shewanella eurypsychrophilus TaxID=2593656 RepID=A0ABX6VDN4_9GAMM|nr:MULTISPECIES: aldehyde dehydrogenase family protein [Shewanella]QPG60555.2 aldehyde dehydrogenase family protein [Shewanella eurypsychrophilus]
MNSLAHKKSVDLSDATLFIDGQWLSCDKNMQIVNPFDHSVLANVACADEAHVSLAVASAKRAFETYKHQGSGERAAVLRGAADLITERLELFAQTIAKETGKPITASRKEVTRCVNTLMLSAEEATRLTGETIKFDSFAGGENRIGHYDLVPLGVVVAITPFNDPLNLAAHKLGPALAAGNSVILKPSQQAPLSALMLVQVLLEAGLPAGRINVLTGSARDFATPLVASKDVAMVTYTGGEVSGEIIAKSAGIKKLAMELGANSPVIVMDDCDLQKAVEGCVSGSFWAVGQNCIGVQRIYIQEGIYEAFKLEFARQTKQLTVGNQLNDATDVGPMINEKEARRIESWVNSAINNGANLLAGGQREGACYYPTVLECVDESESLVCHEAFGPVVSLFAFSDLDETIVLANNIDFSIHGAVFTSNINTAMKVSRELDVAGVMVNDSTDYRLDAMPFGGAKRGSLGREGVKFAIREMSQTKVFCMNL